MEFDKIIQEITSGLTGDSEKDLQYLKEQAEKYKDHEMKQEILRAIGRLFYKCIPENKRAEMDQSFGNDLTSYRSVLEEVQFKQHKKQFDEALVLMEGLIRKFEEANLFTDDQVSEYHCFTEFFEEALYKYYTQPKREIRRPSFPLDEFYLQYGSLLIDMKRYKEASAALKTAMRWNPANAQIAFEYAETYKLQGDMDSFLSLTICTFKYAFRPEQVAHCYRNLGYYFTEKRQWEEAVACLSMSLSFEKDAQAAMSELYYIQQKAGKVIPRPSTEFLKKLSEKYAFPLGADPDVLGLSYNYGKHFAETGNFEGARYLWEITYNLTDDENIKKMMDELPVK